MIKYPSYEEVQEQLREEFAKCPVELSDNDIADLSRVVSDFFSEMVDKPYEGFAIYTQETPCVCLKRWQTEAIRRERMYYARDYSSITLRSLDYTNLTIHVIVAWGVKRIELHFVSPMTDEEKAKMNEDMDNVMNRMGIDLKSRDSIKEMIRGKACVG